MALDDKAGVAIIMEAVRRMLENPDMKRPRIVVAFTSDEGIGRGMDNFSTARFGADFACPVDGEQLSVPWTAPPSTHAGRTGG
ncbi:MAG: M20/M25/M40 family metallo-hydrolase [Rhodopseudomonas palustris]|nr:M20/M25/M40 family metallo-hydrolase [Rhodopseudomonas palustris]